MFQKADSKEFQGNTNISNTGSSGLSGKAEFFNRLLRKSGFELQRRGHMISELTSQSRCATAGWTLEFVGSQGIGKTTLNNKLYKTLRSKWFFRSDLGQTSSPDVYSGPLEQLHRQIYFQKILWLYENEPDIWKNTTISRQMSRVISESLTILTNDFPRGFILDESLYKNFPHEVMDLADNQSAPLWQRRAFIYLKARNPDFVVSRYQSRVIQRARNGLLQSQPADDEVRARVEKDNVLFDTMTERARTFDCPVLVLYAEDNEQENVRKILEFEKTFHAAA